MTCGSGNHLIKSGFVWDVMKNLRIDRKLRISVIVAIVCMLGTIVMTAAISVRASVLVEQDHVGHVPMTTSGNNVFMACTNNDTGHWNV
jgi:hypothetical protein